MNVSMVDGVCTNIPDVLSAVLKEQKGNLWLYHLTLTS